MRHFAARFVPVLAVLSLAGCGGNVGSSGSTPGSMTPHDGGPASTDAGTPREDASPPPADATSPSPLVAACPTSPPEDGSACATEIICEYGDQFDYACNTLAICDDTHKWGITPPSCTDENPGLGAGCAPSFAVASQGGACSSEGVICDFPQGRCGCEQPMSAGGPGEMAPPDAGDAGDAGPSLVWDCQEPLPKGCPASRPLNGEPCDVGSNVTCEYGACGVPGSVMMLCESGAWQGDLPIARGAA